MNNANDTFVLLSDDALLLRALMQSTSAHATVLTATSVPDALKLCAGRRVRAIIVDGAQQKTNVTAELSRLRLACPLASLLFVASPQQTRLLNELQPLRVEFLARPLPPTALAGFVERAVSSGCLSGRSMRAWIDELASECRLTHKDLALMPLVLDEETPEQVCERLGIDRDVLTRSLRRLVKKCRVRNTDRLAKNLMRDALLFSREATAELIEPMSARAAAF